MSDRDTILTTEERDILILSAKRQDGHYLSNVDIARHLGISVNRVKTLIHQVCLKLRARNRIEARYFAVGKKVIRIDELYTLEELAEYYWVLHPDVLRRIAHLGGKDMKHEDLLGNDEQIIPTDRRKGAVLTKSEREVLALVGRGLTNREIANKLCISINTVITCLYRASTKLGVHKRSDAVNMAVRLREVSLLDMYSFGVLLEFLIPLGAESLEKIAKLMSQNLERVPAPKGS